MLIVPGGDLARNLTVAGSAKRDPREGSEREARGVRGSGGGAPGKPSWGHALYIVRNALFGRLPSKKTLSGGLLSRTYRVRILHECRRIKGNDQEGNREMGE